MISMITIHICLFLMKYPYLRKWKYSWLNNCYYRTNSKWRKRNSCSIHFLDLCENKSSGKKSSKLWLSIILLIEKINLLTFVLLILIRKKFRHDSLRITTFYYKDVSPVEIPPKGQFRININNDVRTYWRD